MNGNAETKTPSNSKCHSLAQFHDAVTRLAHVARTTAIRYHWSNPTRGQPGEEDKDQVFWQVSNCAATSGRAKPSVSMPCPKSASLSFTSNEVPLQDFDVKDPGSFGVVNLSGRATAMVMLIRNNAVTRSQAIGPQSFAIFTNPKESETTVRIVSADVADLALELALVQTYSPAELSHIKWTDADSVKFAVADLTEWISQQHADLVDKLNQQWKTSDAARFVAWFTVAHQRSAEKTITDLAWPECLLQAVIVKPPLAEGVNPVDVLSDYFTNTLMCLDKVLTHVKFNDPGIFICHFERTYSTLFTRRGSKLAEPPYTAGDFRVDTDHETFRTAVLLCFFKQVANTIGLENVKHLRSVNHLYSSRISQVLANCVDLMSEEQKEQLGADKKPRKKPVVPAIPVEVVDDDINDGGFKIIPDDEATADEDESSDEDAPKKKKKAAAKKKKGSKKRTPKRKTPDEEESDVPEKKVNVADTLAALQREADADEEQDMVMVPTQDQRTRYIEVVAEMVKNRKVQTESVWADLGERFLSAFPQGVIKLTGFLGTEAEIHPGQYLVVLLKLPLVNYRDIDVSKFNQLAIKLRDEVEKKTMIASSKDDLDKNCKVALADWPIANTTMYMQSNGDYRRVSRLGFTYNPDRTGALAFSSLDWLSVLIYAGPTAALDHLETEFHKEGMEQYVYRTVRR